MMTSYMSIRMVHIIAIRAPAMNFFDSSMLVVVSRCVYLNEVVGRVEFFFQLHVLSVVAVPFGSCSADCHDVHHDADDGDGCDDWPRVCCDEMVDGTAEIAQDCPMAAQDCDCCLFCCHHFCF